MKPVPCVLSQIRGLLKQHPEGLNIQELAEMTGINRNSASKYLEILRSRGTVDMRRLGNTKVFFLCNRIPIAPILRFIRGAVVVVDFELVVQQMNPCCTLLLARSGSYLAGLHLSSPALGPFSDPAVTAIAQNAVHGIEGAHTISMRRCATCMEVEVSAIPVLLDDGRPGAALVIEDEVTPRDEGWMRLHGAILRDLAEPICRFSADGTLLSANRAFAEAAGLPAHAVTGTRNPFLGAHDSPLLTTLLCALTPDRPTHRLEMSESPSDDSSSLQWRVHGLFDGGGRLKEMVAVGHSQPAAPRDSRAQVRYLPSPE